MTGGPLQGQREGSAQRIADAAPSAASPTDSRPGETKTAICATNWHSMWLVVFVSLIATLCVTGMLLMTTYSPGVSSAWGSVWYIQTRMTGGWFVRGLHRVGSDALILLSAVYLGYLLVRRLYQRPHGARWWTGLAFLFGGMAIALTGSALPWDQHGYWGMTVRLNILARTPIVGDALRRLLIGGSELGALTLTRLYTLHVLLLPGILVAATVWWFRRERRVAQGNTDRTKVEPIPAQRTAKQSDANPPAIFRNACAWVIVFGVIALTVCYMHWVMGAAFLDAPANASATDYPARPEWFNLFLFQWLKGFHTPRGEVIGSVVVPGVILLVLLVVPWLDRAARPGFGRGLTLLFCVAIGAGSVWLTVAALLDDAAPSPERVAKAQALQQQGEPLSVDQEAVLRANAFNIQRARATQRGRRAIELANMHGIPPDGPGSLLANDPVTRGPELFAAHCASCHRFDGHNGLGDVPAEPATSSDLAGFATRAWIAELLADPMSDNHFGLMKKPNGDPAHTRMAEWLSETRAGWANDDDRATFEENLAAAAEYLESESLTPGRFAQASQRAEGTSERGETQGGDSSRASAPTQSDDLIRRGRAFFMATCNECHSYKGERTGTFRAPDMYGYGSVEWIEKMIRNPGDNALYRTRGREPAQMPAFADKLSEQERRLIAQWIHETRNTTP